MPVPKANEARREVEELTLSIQAMALRIGAHFQVDDQKQKNFISAAEQQKSSSNSDDRS